MTSVSIPTLEWIGTISAKATGIADDSGLPAKMTHLAESINQGNQPVHRMISIQY